jgi:sialic acid synthase SpsE
MSKKTANIFRKSLYWSLDLKAGSKITKSHMIVRKPWSEIDAAEFQDLLGKEVKRNVAKGLPIRKKDIK